MAKETTKLSWLSPLEDLYKTKKTPKSLDKLKSAGISTLNDLLWSGPLSIDIIPGITPFHVADENEYLQAEGEVVHVIARPSFRSKGFKRAPLMQVTAVVKDLHGPSELKLTWFNCYPNIIKKIKSMKKIVLLGKVSSFGGRRQLANPKFDSIEKGLLQTPGRCANYPTINSVTPRIVASFYNKIPANLWDNIEESLPETLLKKRNLITLGEAFKIIHGRSQSSSLEDAKKRVIYEEFLDEQLKFLLRRNKNKSKKSDSIKLTGPELKSVVSMFPYKLTDGQNSAIKDIFKDMASGHPMNRLIQGDVGCGKTTVALISAYAAIKSKKQAAIMCPTESLANQHYETASNLFEGTGIKVTLITGSLSAKKKRELYLEIKLGMFDLIIGTHALFYDGVQFKDLGLAVIDEQHRFGVDQRIRLVEKGEGTHALIMTATPIPRSLSLTQYGDLDVSIIDSLPSGRKGIQTRIVDPSKMEPFLSFINTRISMGEQAYVVVPAIEDNPEQDFLALEKVFTKFVKFYPKYKIGYLHGKMPPDEKTSRLKEFSDGKIDLLVSTSVIEVGIDIPNATIMAIINAERFGLSSLHQLRGRVGRAEKPGFCFLVVDKMLPPDTMYRLKVIESTIDGFKIAEEDLGIRGEGDLLGKVQAGEGGVRKFANLGSDQKILFEVKEDLNQLVTENNKLIHSKISKFSEDTRVFSTI